MKRLIPACALAAALGVTAYAQDNTVKTKTQVKADDARAVTMRGCLTQDAASGLFSLSGAITATGEDLTSKTRVETDVDDDDVEVKTKTATKVDRDDDDDKAVGTSGTAAVYELSPRAGVNLAAHVGHQVEIGGVMVDKANGDDDAEVKIEEKTRVENEDAPDAKARTKTELEIPRGAHARLTVVSVKALGASCQ